MFWMFSAGGVVMVPVAIVGILAVAVGIRHASGPERAWSAAASTLRFATLAMAAAGFAIDLSTVATVSAAAEEAMGPILSQGLAESLAPVILGGALASLGALFAAVGDLRTSGIVSHVR